MERITVICPVYNEEKHIIGCIESILSQDYLQSCMEVFFVDGMSNDNTRYIIKEYCKRYPFIFLLDNPNKIVPTALNIGITNSTTDIIIRLDAHAIYPKGYFKTLVKYLKELDADNVGGVCKTLPLNDTSLNRSIAAALSSSFGMGNSYFRVGSSVIRQVDTVPFGCFKKEIFSKIGLFDEELTRNQDDEFNGRIIKHKGKIYLLPELVISYYSRDSISKVSKMFYQYGLFKPLVNKKLGAPATCRQFFPLFFLLGIIFGGILSAFSDFILSLYLIIISLYIILALAFAIKESKKWKDLNFIIFLPILFFVIHISYGWGYLVGIFRLITKRSISVSVNR